VAAARAAGHGIESVPGPSAVTTALALAGIEAPGFLFGGFLPTRPISARRTALQRLLEASGDLELPLILYEAPHRVMSLLSLLAALAPEARVVAGRELTKRNEQVVLGSPDDVAAVIGKPRGEFTLVVRAVSPPRAAGPPPTAGPLISAARRAGLPDRTTVELLRATGIGRRDAYRLVRASSALDSGHEDR
jgi:16S rRNA (cytidine1402-2'-O)-methyltransferase